MTVERYAWIGTVKLQRPFSPSDAALPVLVYDEDETIRVMLPQNPDLLAFFEPHAFKVYVRAGLREDGTLDLKHKVEDEPW